MRKRKWLSALLAVLMVVSMLPTVAFADGSTPSVTMNGIPYDSIADALAVADAGNTITLGKGTYNGNITLNKGVSLQGAGVDETIINGSVHYDGFTTATDDLDLTVSGMTIQSPAGNTTDQQAIHLANHGTVANANLSVSDVKIVDFLFGVGVNSGASNCTLNVTNLTLENVWCGASVSEGAGNTIESFDVAEGSTVNYEVQVFGSATKPNAYYETYEACVADTTGENADLTSNDQMPNLGNGAWPPVVEVNGSYFSTLQEAINTYSGQPMIINLLDDVAVGPVNNGVDELTVPAGADITVNGNGHTITTGSAVFSSRDGNNLEGLQSGTKITVSNVDFQGETENNTIGHAAIIGINASGVEVTFTGCTFTDLYDAVYFNVVADVDATPNTINISNSTFDNVANYYGVDDGYTAGGRVDKYAANLADNTVAEGSAEPNIETFSVASVDGIGYMNIEDAIEAAANVEDKTVTLRKDIVLDSMLTIDVPDVTLDLNQHTISSGDSFIGTGNAAHLVDITADGVTLKNGTLEAGANNNHTLNIWNADNVNISDLTLDGSAAEIGGAPLIIGASDVTASGDIKTITGANSWYAINVDSRVVSGTDTGAALNIEDANMTFEGTNPTGIYIENTAGVSADELKVSFGENVTVTSDIPNFVAVVKAENVDATIENPENAGLETDENGDLIIHEHQWGETPASWTWSADHSTATAVFTCINCTDDPAATCEVAGTVTSNVLTEATCEKDGVMEYIATVTFGDRQFVDTERVAIPATGHNFVDGVCSVCGAEEGKTPTTPDDGKDDQTTTPENGKDDVPQTGDNSNLLVLWIALAVLSGGTALALGMKKKRIMNER